jgi:thiol-disulfide isomerase/thioredoxin
LISKSLDVNSYKIDSRELDNYLTLHNLTTCSDTRSKIFKHLESNFVNEDKLMLLINRPLSFGDIHFSDIETWSNCYISSIVSLSKASAIYQLLKYFIEIHKYKTLALFHNIEPKEILTIEYNNVSLHILDKTSTLTLSSIELQIEDYVKLLKTDFHQVRIANAYISDGRVYRTLLGTIEKLTENLNSKYIRQKNIGSIQFPIHTLCQSSKRCEYIIYYVWSINCPPCIEKLKQLSVLSSRKNNLVTIAYCVDSEFENEKDSFTENKEYESISKFEVIDSNLIQKFNVNVIPSYFLVNGNGCLIADNLRSIETSGLFIN